MTEPVYLACPTDVVAAPIEVVWRLLTDFSGWGNFYDVRVVSVDPPGPAVVGQRMRGHTGPRWLRLSAVFQFTRIDSLRHELELDVRLPLGIAVHENLDCRPVGPDRCRVNYHCHFGLPTGWRGGLLRRLIGRGFETGPADSLNRLKHAAEDRYRRETATASAAREQ